jgi:hypothetical protein
VEEDGSPEPATSGACPRVAGDHAPELMLGRRVSTIDEKRRKGCQPSGEGDAGNGAAGAATSLGHRLCLDLGLAEVVGRHRCRRGRGRGEDHRFRQRKARVGCASAALWLPERGCVSKILCAEQRAEHPTCFSDFRRI